MRRIKMILAGAVLVLSWLAPAPSSACYGEICDGICDTMDWVTELTPGEKFDNFTHCQLR